MQKMVEKYIQKDQIVSLKTAEAKN